MTEAELERLASLIADAVRRQHDRADVSRETWLVSPVRPTLPERPSTPPSWSGAAQSLGDVAPIRQPTDSPHRRSTGELTRATRAAAAGHGDVATGSGVKGRATHSPAAFRRRVALPVTVGIGVSNRHLHLSADHVRALFGTDQLTSLRSIRQPGQFAANETVAVEGPKGRIAAVRVVGPARGETQLELARSDAATLGVDPPLAASGRLDASVGGVILVGPHGRVELTRGVIVPARHLHLSPGDGERWGLRDGDRVDVRAGTGARRTMFYDVLVRCGPANATEVHLDADEAHAAALKSGDSAAVVAVREPTSEKRRLVTERDVIAIAKAGGVLPIGALLTPSAKDRARMLGLEPK